VIDLDTVMPGYFISDVGDMMRTYLPAFSEEEKDTGKIEVREEYFHAIVKGYLKEMSAELSREEIDYFVYAGIFMTYMQAIRFLADYLNNDEYYGARYEGQNYVRARNQITFLQKMLDKEIRLNEKVKEIAGKYQ
ncbi:MAG TPA: aminoglycoside phosphotransferase family protein, partial [Puia sp.]